MTKAFHNNSSYMFAILPDKLYVDSLSRGLIGHIWNFLNCRLNLFCCLLGSRELFFSCLRCTSIVPSVEHHMPLAREKLNQGANQQVKTIEQGSMGTSSQNLRESNK